MEGEAGSGYRLLAGYDLPPLMLTTKESEALIAADSAAGNLGGGGAVAVAGIRPGEDAGDPAGGRVGARRSRPACLPLTLARIAMLKPILTLSIRPYPISRYYSFTYQDESGQVTWREGAAAGAVFLGERWLLVAWCELRNDYRNFRLDRCLEVRRTERRFSECADRSLSDFLRKVRCEVRRNKKARAAGAAARALSCCISNQKL